jgi:hypothetical protein
MADLIDTLRPELAKALRLELDEGETLRWCGQPSPDRVFWRLFPIHMIVTALFGGFAILPIAGFVSTMREIADSKALGATGPSDLPTGMLIALGCLLVFFPALAIASARRPFAERRRARNIIYAVTNTRVFTVFLHNDARVTTEAVEPGHPLQLLRREHKDGTGDVLLYPRARSDQPGSAVTASMILVGVPDPRTVERLIRTTFDPPGR